MPRMKAAACVARVCSRFSEHERDCGAASSVLRDGRPYCKNHDPERKPSRLQELRSRESRLRWSLGPAERTFRDRLARIGRAFLNTGWVPVDLVLEATAAEKAEADIRAELAQIAAEAAAIHAERAAEKTKGSAE